MYVGLQVQCLLLHKAWIFSTGFNVRSALQNVTKMRHAGAHLFHSDGQMDGQTRRQSQLLPADLRTLLKHNDWRKVQVLFKTNDTHNRLKEIISWTT